MQNKLTTQTWSNIAATPAAFTLPGGLYGLTAMGTFGPGTITLQRLAPASYITALPALSANGYESGYLPSGQYQLEIVSTTAVYADVVGIAETP